MNPCHGQLRPPFARRFRAGILGASVVAGLLAVAVAGPADARPSRAIDCPLRTTGYSVDSPLLDILLKPEAKAAIAATSPKLLFGRGDDPNALKSPSLMAILTPRVAAGMRGAPDADLASIDKLLKALPVSAEDQVRRCARYDEDKVIVVVPAGRPRLLLFEKMTGFRDGPSVNAAHAAFVAMAARNGWSLTISDKGGVMTPANLKKFDAVIWNNVSGDVLTIRQRQAFENYIRRGGGYVGIHGSAGDFRYYWDWYADTLIGARFIGHPMAPQFQNAHIVVEPSSSAPAQLCLPIGR